MYLLSTELVMFTGYGHWSITTQTLRLETKQKQYLLWATPKTMMYVIVLHNQEIFLYPNEWKMSE